MNIYLKISHRNRKKKIVFVLRNLYTVLYEHINVLSLLNKCGVQSFEQFDKNLGQHSKVMYLGEYKISIVKEY